MDLRKVTPYPLSFTPLFKQKVWGGRRLGTALGKTIPPGISVGESWELVDLPEDQSVVQEGPAAGAGLHELVDAWGPALLGSVPLDGGRFPLLVKYIDAHQPLSMQVHPDAGAAERLGGRPKGEAWYILEVDPGGKIYRGLLPGVEREDLARAVDHGRVEELLQVVQVQPGDLVPVPPGTVHAIGAGVLLAEVQQPSDTTYRFYDWGRLDLDGRPRALHVPQALDSIHFGAPPPEILREGAVDVALFRFTLDELEGGCGAVLEAGGPRVLVGLDGQARVHWDGRPAGSCGRGEVVLLPAACGPVRLEAATACRFLEVTFPGQ